MANRSRLTNNSDETDIGTLISGDVIFSIPYFQRPYKWKPERLKQLNSDLLDLVDESSDFHFLGAVIIHGRRSNPSDPTIFDVIDGQQRITTLFLYLFAAVKTLCSLDRHAEASALFLKFLVINRDTGALSNFKLQSCKDDRSQLNQVYLDVLSDPKLREKLGGFKLRPLPKSGGENGALKNNYKSALKFFKDEVEQGGIERLQAIYSALLNKISVVQIDVWDPTNGPKIFDSLNSRQEPMTVGDLIRNDVFARVASEHPDIIERVDAEFWQPFYKKFDVSGRNLFDAYFFPYGLVKQPNLKKSEVYSALRKDWDGVDDPELIIRQLAEYQDAFIDLNCGSNLSNLPRPVAAAFQTLYSTRLPSSTLPFLMQVVKAAASGALSEANAVATFSVIESFLVKRAICGHEPTGLHNVFKRLWRDCDGQPLADLVTAAISAHKTVPWPGQEELRRAIEVRNLYTTSITPFVVREYDKSFSGDTPLNVPWLEHVLPQNPEESWFQKFTKEQHASMKDRLANLVPLSSEMNRALSNKPYSDKRPKIQSDSMFKSARAFAENIEDWTPDALDRRSTQIADWAVARWPHERSS